jgi:DNA-binding NtrC family response regulator
MIGFCPKMRELYEVIDTISIENPMVLIQGESGTGKNLTARTIHDHSDRKARCPSYWQLQQPEQSDENRG